MTITIIQHGIVKLTAPRGIYAIREGRVYSEVICRERDIRLYREATEDD